MGSMIYEKWPLVPRSQLVTSFRPGSRGDSESPFRTMREHGWVTPGVRVVVYAEGKIVSRLQLFSALNIDSAREARHGHTIVARQFAEAAAKVEQSPEVLALVALLRHLPESVVKDFLSGHMPPKDDFPAIWKLVSSVTLATAHNRSQILREHAPAHRDAAIQAFEGGKARDGEPFGNIPSERFLADEEGNILVIVSEITEGGQIITDLVPGVCVSEENADFDPFRRTKEPLVLPPGLTSQPGQARWRDFATSSIEIVE